MFFAHFNPNYKNVTLLPRPDACVLKIKLTQIFRFPLWYILEKDLGFISVFFADFFPGNTMDYSPEYILCFSMEYLWRTRMVIFALRADAPFANGYRE